MQKRKGISLIVLVITIIVMIILAGTIIISLNNSGIIGKAQDAVDAANLNEVKNLANVAWAEAYMNGARAETELNAAVKQALTKNNITEDHYKGYTIIVTATGVDFGTKALNPSGVIPEGGVYYVGVTSTYEGTYTGATATYTAGDSFPTTVTIGDIYVYGDYEYRYNQSGYNWNQWTTDNTQNGWGVKVIDDEQTTYGLILETVNNKYITSLEYTFEECTELSELSDDFIIPKGVTNMRGIFKWCVSLELPEGFAIPNGVTDISEMFLACESLTKLPEGFNIPNSVTTMFGMFEECYSLTSLPEGFKIPNGVTDVAYLFDHCTSLTKLPKGFKIPNSVKNLANMFGESALEELPDGFTIPNSVKDMDYAFGYCNLTTLPDGFVVPNSVTRMQSAFAGCDLSGTITINANPTSYYGCFYGIEQPIVLTGSSTMLDELAATSENGNVTVK